MASCGPDPLKTCSYPSSSLKPAPVSKSPQHAMMQKPKLQKNRRKMRTSEFGAAIWIPKFWPASRRWHTLGPPSKVGTCHPHVIPKVRPTFSATCLYHQFFTLHSLIQVKGRPEMSSWPTPCLSGWAKQQDFKASHGASSRTCEKPAPLFGEQNWDWSLFNMIPCVRKLWDKHCKMEVQLGNVNPNHKFLKDGTLSNFVQFDRQFLPNGHFCSSMFLVIWRWPAPLEHLSTQQKPFCARRQPSENETKLKKGRCPMGLTSNGRQHSCYWTSRAF